MELGIEIEANPHLLPTNTIKAITLKRKNLLKSLDNEKIDSRKSMIPGK